MTLKQFFTYCSMISLISCSDNSGGVNNVHSADSAKSQLQKSHIDSITRVDILYKPSFTNSSILQLNRANGEGVFMVDTMAKFTYGSPDTLRFLIKEMEAKTDLEKFWSSSFIQSLRQDISMLGWRDGMPVFVYFINNGITDSVYLGNVYPKNVNGILMQQLNYLHTKSDNRAMKAYIKQVKGHL